MLNALVAMQLRFLCELAAIGNNGSGNAMTLAVDRQLPKQPTILLDGYIAFPDIGVAYKCYPDVVTWDVARRRCMADGAVLAEIDNFVKLKYANNIREANQSPWVGIHRLFNVTECTSVKTGREVTNLPLHSTSHVGEKSYRCFLIQWDGKGLRAHDCAGQSHFICEIPLPID